MSQKFIVILGSGPGVGVATGSVFASKGFDVALLSRNSERLQQDAEAVRQANPKSQVKTYAVDISDHVALQKALDQVKAELGSPEVVLFNAARVGPSVIGEATTDIILEDFKTTNIGLYVAATWALPLLEETAKRPGTHASFLLSGGGLYKYPFAPYFSLSMQKAAQTNFLGSFAQVAGPKGIHVGNVNIGGVVADEDPILNRMNIANKLLELHQQDQQNWQSQVDLGDIRDLIEKWSGQRPAE